MQMTQTIGAVAPNQYAPYVSNCNRNPSCVLSYAAPLPSVANLQLYVNFGSTKPATMEFKLINICNGDTEQIFSSNYVAGQDSEGNWYGVFKYFNAPAGAITSFVVWLSSFVNTNAGLQEQTYFSELLLVEPCQALMKIKACQPASATTTAFDYNGVYYGLPQNVDYLGISEVRYFHTAWVRSGKVVETAFKATFTGSVTRNFRTQVDKTLQFQCEIVPKWYKDELLAIFTRGKVQIDDANYYLLSDLAFTGLNDDDAMWKPWAVFTASFRGFYGCDDSECIECCSPTVISAHTTDNSHDESGSGSESESESVETGNFTINYTNNLPIPVRLQVHNGGVGALTDVYNANFTPPVVIGTSPDMPAVDALVVFSIGGGKHFTQVFCNGVPNAGAIGSNVASWVGVNGPVTISFISN